MTLTLPPNFVLLKERIPGSWLIQINGAGHGLMYQYPDALSQCPAFLIPHGGGIAEQGRISA